MTGPENTIILRQSSKIQQCTETLKKNITYSISTKQKSRSHLYNPCIDHCKTQNWVGTTKRNWSNQPKYFG